ncbi:Hypothetical predicted protein, partial [Paramuricea clavata]
QDELCFFRCLVALHRGCHSPNLERDTKRYNERYVHDDRFECVTLEELPELKKLYETAHSRLSIVQLCDEENEKKEFVVQLVQHSHRTAVASVINYEKCESAQQTQESI